MCVDRRVRSHRHVRWRRRLLHAHGVWRRVVLRRRHPQCCRHVRRRDMRGRCRCFPDAAVVVRRGTHAHSLHACRFAGSTQCPGGYACAVEPGIGHNACADRCTHTNDCKAPYVCGGLADPVCRLDVVCPFSGLMDVGSVCFADNQCNSGSCTVGVRCVCSSLGRNSPVDR